MAEINPTILDNEAISSYISVPDVVLSPKLPAIEPIISEMEVSNNPAMTAPSVPIESIMLSLRELY